MIPIKYARMYGNDTTKSKCREHKSCIIDQDGNNGVHSFPAVIRAQSDRSLSEAGRRCLGLYSSMAEHALGVNLLHLSARAVGR